MTIVTELLFFGPLYIVIAIFNTVMILRYTQDTPSKVLLIATSFIPGLQLSLLVFMLAFLTKVWLINNQQ